VSDVCGKDCCCVRVSADGLTEAKMVLAGIEGAKSEPSTGESQGDRASDLDPSNTFRASYTVVQKEGAFTRNGGIHTGGRFPCIPAESVKLEVQERVDRMYGQPMEIVWQEHEG
jgi:hypothetical protein